MSQQFSVSYDDYGNLSVRSGWVIQKGQPDLRVGPAESTRLPRPVTGELPAREGGGYTYLGGSGRNLVVSGFPVSASTHDGVWRHGYPGKWSNGKYTLIHTAGGTTTVTDGTDVLAQRASGGPLGALASTTYGQAQLGAAFTLAVAAEWSAPGAAPKQMLITGATGVPELTFTQTDPAHYAAVEDPRFTIDLLEDGHGNLRFSGDVIAIRDDGANDSADGEYESNTAGQMWNPESPPEDYEYIPPPVVNPFGVLTVVYSWPAVPDLDTTTEFLDQKVGFSAPAHVGASYMTWSGDNTAPSGQETVVIDLAAAWAAGKILQTANIRCMADWYPVGSYGPASFAASYSVPGFTPLAITIQPGNVRPGATTVVANLTIHADGGVTRYTEPWTAVLTRQRIPPPQGVVYLKEVTSAGVLTSMAGPFFDPAQPADTATEFYIPLAVSDGNGQVEAVWAGPILRR